MKTLPALLFIALLATGLSSCKKQSTGTEFTDTPIISGYLQRGNYFTCTISRQIPFSSNVSYSSDDINHLQLHLTASGTTHTLSPLGNGQYIDSSLMVSTGATYQLNFQFNSKQVSAYTYVPSTPMNMKQSVTEMEIEQITSTSGFPSQSTQPDPLEITWDNPDKSYYLLVIENMETTLVPIRDFGNGTAPSNVFKKQPNNASAEEIRALEFQYYGKHRIILYHVLPDYASLYTASSASSQNLSNPSTSIVNGYGIFTGINSDTLYIQIKKP